ncbi:2'-5' RNA ligase family protein [Rhodohalobacter sp. 614A]|uniref:2'-5' RNA ligase family protein n=1 Tax=Rhodohalobacter sp. 614A TaxID=2908649 RepID=UPI001F3BC436|nr:2'-5' RNA ligase family protein [Rhodohalobacter sp. 614A]
MAQRIRRKNILTEKKQIYQFLVVFDLPKWVDKYVIQQKEDFAERFGSFPSRTSIPHMTIAQFPYWVQDQDTILALLQDALYRLKPLQIELNGYDSFSRNSKVIYIHVDESEDLQKLRGPFNRIKQLYNYTNKDFFIFKKPHVTIARGLQEDVFEEAKRDYIPRRYRSSFVKSKLKVLRREIIDPQTFGKYEEVCDLVLGGRE